MSIDEFEALRPRLFGIAYRMLGSTHDAEDVVQDAYLRWDGANRSEILDPKPWLDKVVTNLCLNQLTSARATRENYVGEWLPEPVLTDDGTLGPLETAAQRESVSTAMLVLMERLSPAERAVFVLREAFGYSHRETAAVLEISEEGSRQLFRRARSRLAEEGARFTAETHDHEKLLRRFLDAAERGDVAALEQLLAADVISYADGGGVVSAARRPVAGRNRVARYIGQGIQRFAADVTFRLGEANGQPAVLAFLGGTLGAVFLLHTVDGMITRLHVIANPQKLEFASEQLSRSGRLPGSTS